MKQWKEGRAVARHAAVAALVVLTAWTAAAQSRSGGTLTWLVNPVPASIVPLTTTAGGNAEIGPKIDRRGAAHLRLRPQAQAAARHGVVAEQGRPAIHLFGTTLCDVVRSGVMDMAVLYGEESAVQGLSFDPLLTEDLCVVGPVEMNAPGDLMLSVLRDVDLLLPSTNNRLRRWVDGAFASINVAPRVVAEMESSSTLAAAIASGLGATILPVSVARSVAATASVNVRRLVSPTIEVPLVLCVSDHLPLSEPAQVVRAILLELVEGLHLERGLHLETEVSW